MMLNNLLMYELNNDAGRRSLPENKIVYIQYELNT